MEAAENSWSWRKLHQTNLPASSIRDALISQMEVTFSPLKRSQIKHPKRSRTEEPGDWFFFQLSNEQYPGWLGYKGDYTDIRAVFFLLPQFVWIRKILIVIAKATGICMFLSGPRWWFQTFFIFTLTWGKWSNLTSLFFRWVGSTTHQLVKEWIPTVPKKLRGVPQNQNFTSTIHPGCFLAATFSPAVV